MSDDLWNYSTLQKRETKIYNIGGTSLGPSGISLEFLKVVLPVAAIIILISVLISVLICLITGKANWWNPMGGNFNLWYDLISIGLGIAVGCAMWYVKVNSYRLYEYLIAYFKPKKTYTAENVRNNEYKLTNIKIDTIITRSI